MRPLFIRIPKVASSSIRVAMGKDWGEKVKPRNTHAAHVQAKVLLEANPVRYWASYSYAFVRNPWDRLVSLYHFRGGTDPAGMGPWLEKVLRVEAREGRQIPFPCWDYVSDEDGVESIVNFVGRYETLAEDFAKLRATLALPAVELPRANARRRAAPSYQDYYTSALRDFVADRYESDVAHFGYTFV